MSKLLAIPFPILQSLHKVAICLDPSCVHMTYPVIRAILSHLDAEKDDRAIGMILAKTHWSRSLASEFLSVCISEAKQFLLLRASVAAKGPMREIIAQKIYAVNRLEPRSSHS